MRSLCTVGVLTTANGGLHAPARKLNVLLWTRSATKPLKEGPCKKKKSNHFKCMLYLEYFHCFALLLDSLFCWGSAVMYAKFSTFSKAASAQLYKPS